MAVFTDDFNRADGALASPWSAVVNGGLQITSNEVKSTGGGLRVSALTGESFDDDQSAEAVIATVNGYDFAGVAVRMDASGNGYVALGEFGDGRLKLYRLDAGVPTVISNQVQAISANDVIGLSATGSSLQLLLNDVAVGGAVTDATYGSGYPGLAYNRGDSNLSTLDNFSADGLASATPTITNIDTDNAVNQYQQAIVNVADFTETITSVTLGGTACTVPENDPTDDQITVGVPGSLTTGTYDLVISGATETDTLTGVSYTQTHARPAFDGLVDSNSILSGQSYTADTYFRFVTSFSNGTLDTAAGDAAEWAGDIADYYTPDVGYTGDDAASVQYLYSDGTTSATVVITVSVVDGIVVTVRLKKAMRNTMRKSMKQTMRAR